MPKHPRSFAPLRLRLLLTACALAVGATAAAPASADDEGPRTPVRAGVTGKAAGVAAADALLLSGIDPRVYLQRRHKRADVTAELRALPAAQRVELALAILEDPEAFHKAHGAPAAAYPRDLKADERQALQRAEVEALVGGAFAALSDSGDARAFPALRAAVADGAARGAALQAAALERLGETAHPDAVGVLEAALQAGRATKDSHQVGGAVAGLGRHGSPAALEVLAGVLRPGAVVAGDDAGFAAQTQVAALSALGVLTSRWAWDARVRRDPTQAVVRDAVFAQAKALLAVIVDDSGADPALRGLAREQLARLG
jgi:hypothetical protein